jgi:hypothetical protein
MTEQTLNLNLHIKNATIRALNITQSHKEAAIKLGVTDRTVFNLRKRFNIEYCQTNNYFFENTLQCSN